MSKTHKQVTPAQLDKASADKKDVNKRLALDFLGANLHVRFQTAIDKDKVIKADKTNALGKMHFMKDLIPHVSDNEVRVIVRLADFTAAQLNEASEAYKAQLKNSANYEPTPQALIKGMPMVYPELFGNYVKPASLDVDSQKDAKKVEFETNAKPTDGEQSIIDDLQAQCAALTEEVKNLQANELYIRSFAKDALDSMWYNADDTKITRFAVWCERGGNLK